MLPGKGKESEEYLKTRLQYRILFSIMYNFLIYSTTSRYFDQSVFNRNDKTTSLF